MRLLVAALLLVPSLAVAQRGERARDLGITFGGRTGPANAITDVAGVEVGHATIIRGDGRLVVGRGPVRTGVTALLPRGKGHDEPVFGAIFALNGNGEMTGSHWLGESGLLYGPVMLTNTHSVGVVRDAVIDWARDRNEDLSFSLPIVAETFDGFLNDVNGFHVTREHARAALAGAAGGVVAEGNVGGGTGMICHGFKGGIGTASRKLADRDGGYTVGVLVQCNYGSRRLFGVEGVPVGQEISDLRLCRAADGPVSNPMLARAPRCAADPQGTAPGRTGAVTDFRGDKEGMGSIIVIVATDAPLLPHQLARIARRVPLAIGRMGGLGEDSSGDIFLAFSTQSATPPADSNVAAVRMLDNGRITPLFEATVQATQEAILNSMLAAETMTGADGLRAYALPHDRLVAAMRKYGRPAEGGARGGQ